MNEFGFIEYKKPLGDKDDFRTSTYRGHVYMTDTRLGNKSNAKFNETKPYIEDPVLQEARVSDYKANYGWQYGNSEELRNPAQAKPIFMKDYEDRRLRFIKRPLRPACSVAHEDYLWQPVLELKPPLPADMPSPVQATHIVIDRAKPGYARLLDPSATTMRLDYVHHTPQNVMNGVGAQDNITFWNWKEKSHPTKRVYPGADSIMCETASAECPKRRCEFINQLKPVPHTGLTTEVRANYLEPITRAVEFDTAHIRNRFVYFPPIPFSKHTEYKLYGSGERTQKYV